MNKKSSDFMVNNLFISPKTSLMKALRYLNKAGVKCLLVVNDNHELLGTLTDGDLRRSILNGEKFNTTIDRSYNPDPTFLIDGKFSKTDARQLMVNSKFDLLPIINFDRKIVDYISWDQLYDSSELKLHENIKSSVVIMAGGKGTRLEPFTNVLPKPLIPIHDKPIIEHIIENFSKLGCSDYHITVNYKSVILKAYFEELKPDYKVNFVEEKESLGTAGSLYFLKGKFNRPFFLTNCDIIIKDDYASLYKFHKNGKYDITLVASAKEYIIPYGSCHLNDEGNLSHIKEKPKFDFLINTGLYVLNPGVLKLIPKNKYFHVTDLIEKAKNKGKKIGVFPIDDDAWIDIGQWTEYRKAVDQL